jgi:hypothetical protein
MEIIRQGCGLKLQSCTPHLSIRIQTLFTCTTSFFYVNILNKFPFQHHIHSTLLIFELMEKFNMANLSI